MKYIIVSLAILIPSIASARVEGNYQPQFPSSYPSNTIQNNQNSINDWTRRQQEDRQDWFEQKRRENYESHQGNPFEIRDPFGE
jgi:flagellar biosynthesis chaperone FliJ